VHHRCAGRSAAHHGYAQRARLAEEEQEMERHLVPLWRKKATSLLWPVGINVSRELHSRGVQSLNLGLQRQKLRLQLTNFNLVVATLLRHLYLPADECTTLQLQLLLFLAVWDLF
jgi:hypothetical protein